MKKIITFAIILLCLFSCQRFFEMELPDKEPRLVVNADLRAGEPVEVFVSQSKHVMEVADFQAVDDAKVELIEDGVRSYELSLIRGEENNDPISYGSDNIEIKPGSEYQLIVSKPGLPTASATVRVPFPVEIDNVNLTTRIIDPSTRATITDFILEFEDPLEENFYEISVYYRGEMDVSWRDDPMVFEELVELEAKNPVYQKEYLIGSTNLIIDDVLFNGRKAQIDFSGVLMPELELEVTITLRSISKEYYDYVHTLALQRFNSQDPFSQPVQVYDNIVDGYGILGASASKKYVLTHFGET
ncbi:DUF4249 domain-containing protein [Litoribacter populi]|uniref:DUF4249 domain-containing protein n=1 Tax=Litoribacter populi TaxID=2598460 RepID=UPI00163DC581|nr:DUF4249 domain-containing protein [Litoribacter populi]